MKKTIISLLTFIFVMTAAAPVALAETTLNSPGSMPTITVTNGTNNNCTQGPIDGCWQRSASARPGDIIGVQIYYKNTGNGYSEGTTLAINPKSKSASSSITFSGGVASLTAPRATGSGTVSLSENATVTYISGSARLYTSASSGGENVNESGLFGTSGFNIGTLAPGQQGVLVANFRVGAGDVTPPTNTKYQCNDGIDNDGDGYTDYPSDPGCTSATDDSEYNSTQPNDSCDIDTFKLSRSSIDRGQSATLSWNVIGADRVEINGSSKSKNSSMSVSPYSTTTYTINVNGNNCSDSQSLRLTVNEQNDSNPQAITTIASILSSTAAQLNGIAVPNTTNASTNAWFEWGPTASLGYRTSSKNIGSGSGSTPYSDVVNGLVPGTTYYYRAVVQNQNGTAYGSIVSFRTQVIVQGTTVVNTPTRVVVQTIRDSVTAQSAPSLLELRVESAYDHMCVGGEMEYVVTYRNISAVTLEDTVLRIALPKELTYAGANRGSFDPVDNIITLDIGRVNPGQADSVTIRARVNENAIRGNLTVMTATVVYTNPNTRAQEDAIAYSLITVSDDCPSVLGASVFGFWSFLPNTLLEWLLLILVILALIVLGRNLYKKKEEQK